MGSGAQADLTTRGSRDQTHNLSVNCTSLLHTFRPLGWGGGGGSTFLSPANSAIHINLSSEAKSKVPDWGDKVDKVAQHIYSSKCVGVDSGVDIR